MKTIVLSAAGILLLSAAAMAVPRQEPMPYRSDATPIATPLPATSTASLAARLRAQPEPWHGPVYGWMYPGRHQSGH